MWPDVRLKSSLIYTKSCQINFTRYGFQSTPRSLKITQSGHTVWAPYSHYGFQFDSLPSTKFIFFIPKARIQSWLTFISEPGANVISICYLWIITLSWNKALWLDVPSHMTIFNQSECIISVKLCFLWHSVLKMRYIWFGETRTTIPLSQLAVTRPLGEYIKRKLMW